MHLNDIAVVIGMPRAGTTWLYENLKNHPDLGVSDYKEINRYLREMSDEKYLSYFRGCSKKIKLDISPLYFFDKNALNTIEKKHNKIILLVRKEDEWLISLNNQINKYNKDSESMSRSKQYAFPVEMGKTISFDYSSYQQDKYIDEIKCIFCEKLLVIDFVDLQESPLTVLKAIESHLGISKYFSEGNFIDNKINASDQPMSKVYAFLLRTHLLDFLIPIALLLIPKKVIHRLRKHFVYGQ